ncbi:BtpA/SgcQ family protein [Lachnospiraceae bacterium ASD3451]|uniref:BtpA/SgcQ family protein n=1 Tax=Diplocloster agilis TaxID=2850323 RepID=UPI001E17DA99|nr:BtpA/SgcQ family protein [Diplocloster agilis]MBU9744437.1 BtpA/SgcQ family protein [Diplocloster agilis]
MDIVSRMNSGERVSIGMVHTLALPGSYDGSRTLEEIIRRATADAKTLEDAGFDAVIVENVHDSPWPEEGMNVQQTASLAIVANEVRKAVRIEVGLDACGRPNTGIEIAQAVSGISFVRIPFFVDARIGMYGIMQPMGADAVWLRKRIGADHVKIFADIQVKHTYALREDIPIEASAAWAVETKADAVIITGSTTGEETPVGLLHRVRQVCGLPIVVGSGCSVENVKEQYKAGNGAIVGSSLKAQKNLCNPIDPELARAYILAAKERQEAV